MKRSAPAILALLAAALLVAGCGGGSSGGSSSTAPKGETPPKATAPGAPAGSRVASGERRDELRATAVGCDVALATLAAWESDPACAPGEGSRSSCSVGDFRCQAVKVEAGTAVSCERKGAAVSWLVRPSG
jgi:hypothetical protein